MNGDRTDLRMRLASQDDLQSVEHLLIASGLAPDGLSDHIASILIAEREGKVVATAALEIYGDSALLRSVAVEYSERGTGLGHRITVEAINLARDLKINRLFLLTETAEEFFPKFGFRKVDRAVIPDLVKTSLEFTTICPDSAQSMELEL